MHKLTIVCKINKRENSNNLNQKSNNVIDECRVEDGEMCYNQHCETYQDFWLLNLKYNVINLMINSNFSKRRKNIDG